MRKLNVFIDGSCLNNTDRESAIGGWGYLITDSDFNIVNEANGKIREGVQDSNRAELEALYQALLKMISFKGNCKFQIYTDSKTIHDSLNGDCKRTANRDYWELIEPLCLSKKLNGNFRIGHIHSHHKDKSEDKILRKLNEKADRLAFTGANSLVLAPVKVV